MTDSIDNVQNDINRQSVHIVASPSPLAANTFMYAQELGFMEAPPDFAAGVNSFDSYLLLLVTRGKLNLAYDDKEYCLDKWQLAFLDCSKPHNYYATKDTYCNFLYVYFNGKQARDYFRMLAKDMVPIFNLIEPENIISLMWQIISLHEKTSVATEPMVSLNIIRILTEMCLLINEETATNRQYPGFINNAFHYIGHNFKEKVTLDKLSAVCGVNKFYLARAFKKHTGMTINEYLITTRINKAKTLLRSTDMKIEDIAIEVGFYGASHFIRLFRTREHVTPLYYRQQWK